MSRLADGKLSGVNADGQSTGPSRMVVTSECPLPALIQLALGGQSQRVCRNDQAGLKFLSRPIRWHGSSGHVSVLSIADFEMRRLIVHPAALLQPVGRPAHDLLH